MVKGRLCFVFRSRYWVRLYIVHEYATEWNSFGDKSDPLDVWSCIQNSWPRTGSLCVYPDGENLAKCSVLEEAGWKQCNNGVKILDFLSQPFLDHLFEVTWSICKSQCLYVYNELIVPISHVLCKNWDCDIKCLALCLNIQLIITFLWMLLICIALSVTSHFFLTGFLITFSPLVEILLCQKQNFNQWLTGSFIVFLSQ